MNPSICDIQLSKTCWYFRCSLVKKSCGDLDQAGQRVQTAFASNPAGLRSRLSKTVELPERAGQTNPLHEQSIRDDPYSGTNKQTDASEVRYATERSLPTVVQQSVSINQDVKASRTSTQNSQTIPLHRASHHMSKKDFVAVAVYFPCF